MLVVHTFADRSPISIVTVETVLAGCSEVSPVFVPPKWSRRFMRPAGDPGGHAATLDLLLSGMAGAGHGVAALSFYLGLDEEEVRERAASLGLPEPAEKPLRRPASAKPWSVWDVRLLIALWLNNISAASIAATLGRSPSSIHGKRRWLGLGVRDRKRLTERPVVECRATALPWKPTFDVGAIVARLFSPRLGRLPVVPEMDPVVRFPVDVKWVLGRDKDKDERFSILGFAGLRAPAIAERMLVEFGVRLTEFGGQQPDFAVADRARSSRHDQRIRRRRRRAPRGRSDEMSRGDVAYMLRTQSLVLVVQGERWKPFDLPGIRHQEIPGAQS